MTHSALIAYGGLWFAVGLFKRFGLFCARVFRGNNMMRGE